jgi:8-oxo-dGTP diphosphatase
MAAVVGAAIVRDGRVLAARRTEPPELAGLWEFPGGKVEPGEAPEQAVVREIAEELGVTVRLEHWLGPEVDIAGGWVLTVAVARIVEGVPTLTDHDEIRWLGPDELGEVTWGAPDVPFLPEVADLLRGADLTGPRGIFFDEDDAAAVVARLVAAGYRARVERERLAGEDDDEDHPWAVLTDAPELVLDVLVDEYDGWLDVDEQQQAAHTPLELPTQPRRIKRVGGAQ